MRGSLPVHFRAPQPIGVGPAALTYAARRPWPPWCAHDSAQPSPPKPSRAVGLIQRHGPRPRGPRPPPRQRIYMRIPIRPITTTRPAPPPIPCPPSPPKPRRNGTVDECAAANTNTMKVTSDSLLQRTGGAEIIG